MCSTDFLTGPLSSFADSLNIGLPILVVHRANITKLSKTQSFNNMPN